MHRTIKKTCTIFALALGLLCSSSAAAQTSASPSKAAQAAEQVGKLSSKVQELIKKTRMGNARAALALADCHLNGDGIKKSEINALLSYIVANERFDFPTKDIMAKFDENSVIQMMTPIIENHTDHEGVQKIIEKLKKVSPGDAILAEALIDNKINEDTAALNRVFNEAIDKGSEIVWILQLVFYNQNNDDKTLEATLLKASEKHPIFYNKLGDSYFERANRAEENKMSAATLALYKEAVDCYQAADEWGALGKNAAYRMLQIHSILKKEEGTPLDPSEKKRLEILSRVNTKRPEP